MKGFTNITEHLGGLEQIRPHKQRSSEITFYKDGETLILGKTKSRSNIKTVREFIMLQVWNTLLGEYGKRNEVKPMTIASPYPVGIMDEGNTLLMEYLEGTELSSVYSGNFRAKNPYASEINNVEAEQKSAFLAGRLMRIKDIEGLVHGDFAPRHLLYRRSQHLHSLSVIDVENSGLGDPKEEHKRLVQSLEKQTSSTSGSGLGSERRKNRLTTNLNEGYESVNFDQPIIQDIISLTLRRFQETIPKELTPQNFTTRQTT